MTEKISLEACKPSGREASSRQAADQTAGPSGQPLSDPVNKSIAEEAGDRSNAPRPMRFRSVAAVAPSPSSSTTGSQDDKSVYSILVVDDDEAVHEATRFVLDSFRFEGRKLNIVDAYSGDDARRKFASGSAFALAIIDVVMETDEAGLDLVRWIRDDLKDPDVRLVIRTGQPGRAPEQSVVVDYDINDYREKTDLTSQRLTTLILSLIRSYRDIQTIKRQQSGLVRIIQAGTRVYEARTIEDFAQKIFSEIHSIIPRPDAIRSTLEAGAFAGTLTPDSIETFAATGPFAGLEKIGRGHEPEHFLRHLPARDHAQPAQTITATPDALIAYATGPHTAPTTIYLPALGDMDPTERDLLSLYLMQILSALRNLAVAKQTEESQREMVFRLSEAVETRNKETGNHVRRVALFSREIADELGLDPYHVEQIYYASPLHDVGKIAIPDSILNKPSKLDAEEWKVMQSHTRTGHDMLAGSTLPILRMGATIALEHHEKWAGGGYPNGISGEEISIEARIVALSDVFDALCSDRPYKRAWPLEKALALLDEERGRQFAPDVVDAFISRLPHILRLQALHRDEFIG